MTAPPRPLIICGPSGVGKGTIISALTASDSSLLPADAFGFSVSHTTRKPRQGEENGVHYHFVGREKMKDGIEAGEFVEFAEVHGNYYGTSIKAVQSVQNHNKICILDIDVQGVRSIKSQQSSTSLNPIYVFIAPPSMEALEARLRGRNTEDESSILRRLANAKVELDYGLTEGNFDRVFINDDLKKTCEDMAKQFVEWYPDLLGEKFPPEPLSDNGTRSRSPEDVAQETNLPPPIIDPLSLPKTEDGIKALLAEIDQNCPLEGYSQSQLTYQASGISVKAGKKLDIPLPPVEQDGSKVEWSVTLIDEHSEQLDLEFGLAVIVDGEEVMVREMGRILSPSVNSISDEGERHKERTNSSEGVTSNLEGDQESEAPPSAKGKFTVANSAPVTVVIKLDNSYSWFTPKKINYSFTIIPPVDDNMIQRSMRAKSVFPRLLEAEAAAMKARDDQKARSDDLERIELKMMEKLDQLNEQLERGKQSIQEIHSSAEEAEQKANAKANEIKETLSAVKKEEQSIESCSKQIVALEEECARLKKQWEELKLERQIRQEEKVQLETKAEACRQQRVELQEEINAKKEEEKSKSAELASLEMDLSLMRDNLNDLKKEKRAREAEEKSYSDELSFFQKQIAAVKLRFIEPK